LRENVTAVIVISITRIAGDRSGADASETGVTTACIVGRGKATLTIFLRCRTDLTSRRFWSDMTRD
jgi:hypothetical protein